MSSNQLESAVIIGCAACLIIALVGPKSIADFTDLALALSFGASALWTHWTRRFQKCSKCDWTYDWHFLSFLKSGHLFQSPTDDRLLPDLRRSLEYRLLGVFVLAGIFFSRLKGAPIGPILFPASLFAIITFGLLFVFPEIHSGVCAAEKFSPAGRARNWIPISRVGGCRFGDAMTGQRHAGSESRPNTRSGPALALLASIIWW